MKNGKKIRKCPECGGEVRPGYTELVYDLQYRVCINNVPANVCSQCGLALIPGRVATEVDRLVNRALAETRSQPERSKEIAVEYDAVDSGLQYTSEKELAWT